jgi:hypothetical protein
MSFCYCCYQMSFYYCCYQMSFYTPVFKTGHIMVYQCPSVSHVAL